MVKKWADRIVKIAESLDFDQWTIMAEIERTPKTRSGYFSERDLGRKKPCWEIDISRKLEGLQELGLLQQVNPAKGLWTTTKDGTQVEHYVSYQSLLSKNPHLSSIERT